MKHVTLIILITLAIGASVFLIMRFATGAAGNNPEASKLDISQKLPDTREQASSLNAEDIINQYTWVTFEHPSAPFTFDYPQELSIYPGFIWDEFPSYATTSISLALDAEEAKEVPHKQILITAVSKESCIEIPHHPYCPDTTGISTTPVNVMGYEGYMYEGIVRYAMKDYSNIKRYVFAESDNIYMLTFYKDYSTDKTELKEPDGKYEILFDRLASSFQINRQIAANYSELSTYRVSHTNVVGKNWTEEIWHVSPLKIKYQYPADFLEDLLERQGYISKAFYEKQDEPQGYTGSHIIFTNNFFSGYFPQEVLGMINGEPAQTVTIAGQPGYVKEGTINKLGSKDATQVKLYTFEKDNYVYIFAYYKGEGKDFSETFDGIVSSLEIVE